MKRLLLLSMICLLGLAGCETYCAVNYPPETIAVDFLPDPSISDVDYPEDDKSLRTTLFKLQAGEITEDKAVAHILGEYALPLVSLVDAWKLWADDVKGQMPDG